MVERALCQLAIFVKLAHGARLFAFGIVVKLVGLILQNPFVRAGGDARLKCHLCVAHIPLGRIALSQAYIGRGAHAVHPNSGRKTGDRRGIVAFLQSGERGAVLLLEGGRAGITAT